MRMPQVRFRNFKLIFVLLLSISFVIYFTLYFISYFKLTKPPLMTMTFSGPIYFTNYTSSCGIAGDHRGPGQKIISYSLFASGKYFHFYKRGIEKNLHGLTNVYNKNGSNDWVIRIYSDLEITQDIHLLRYKFPQFDWCDVKELFPDIYLMMNPRSWRFLPLADPLVEILLSRDIDSELLEREKSAVDEWIRSNFTYHVMRDNPYHGDKMLAGMWGIKLKQIKSFEALQILENCILSGKMNDQEFLAKYIWDPYMEKNEILAHDSYHCIKFPKNSLPFPSRRDIGLNFVGQQVMRKARGLDVNSSISICPLECRPKFGQDWTFC